MDKNRGVLGQREVGENEGEEGEGVNAPEAGGRMLRLDWHRHLWTSASMLNSDGQGRQQDWPRTTKQPTTGSLACLMSSQQPCATAKFSAAERWSRCEKKERRPFGVIAA